MVFWLDYLLLVYGLGCVCGVVDVCALWCLVLLVAVWVLGSVVLCYSVRRWGWYCYVVLCWCVNSVEYVLLCCVTIVAYCVICGVRC